MCCRISCSSPYSRLINGLLIFLAAFVIGFIASQSLSWLVLTKAETSRLVQRVPPSITPRPNVAQNGPLAIQYLYTQPGPGAFRAVFQVTNLGSQTVRFPAGDDGCHMVELNQYGLAAGLDPCEIAKDNLGLFESTLIKSSFASEDPPRYYLALKYTIDSDAAPQFAALYVKHPHKF